MEHPTLPNPIIKELIEIPEKKIDETTLENTKRAIVPFTPRIKNNMTLTKIVNEKR